MNNQRIDQSPAHIAIREAFVNLCVHPDYKAEGSLSVVFKNGTYIFSNPGTLLVSREQFFEGGESICRNPTIQKMFMMLGPAEKAGSGVAKIMEGWRSNNWTAPRLFERTRPDKIEFKLTMQSLIQPEIQDELDRRLNIVSHDCSSHEQMILSLALTEEYVTNERLRYVLGLHKSDITLLLQQMCRQNLLLSEGYGRGTKYRLIDSRVSFNDDSSSVNSDSSAANGDSYVANGDSNALSNDEVIYYSLSTKAQTLLKKKRLNAEEMGSVVCEICLEWRTIQEIADVLGKSVIHLRNNILSNLISNGLLEREFPSIPNHPNQRYRRVSSSSTE